MAALEQKTIDGFRIDIEAEDSITYATAFNGKSIIRELTIHSTSPRILTDVTIEVSLHSLGQALSQPWKAQIGTWGENILQFENLNIDFNSELLFQQKDTVPAELKIAIKENDVLLSEAMWNLALHSPNTWIYTKFSKETIAAYVQPNHPSMRKVLDEVVRILQQQDQPAVLSGYQLLNHVRPMVEATYQAMLNQNLTYSDPPASWDIPMGQRVRDAQTVLDEKVGTCLDTAVLFAGLLEASGLEPVVAVIPGHAFVGYWTAKYFSEQDRSPNWTELPIAEVINAIDNGYIELFETTSICIGDGRLEYGQAIKESLARISLTEGLGLKIEKSTLVNISACRAMLPRPIRPMPAVYRAPDGTTQVVEYKPLEFNVNLLREQLNKEGAQGSAADKLELQVPPVVKRWLDSLLDLSLRNPLISFKEPTTSVPLLAAPEILGVLEDLLQNRQTLTLLGNPFVGKNGENIENHLLDARGEFKAGRESAEILSKALSRREVIAKQNFDVLKPKLQKMISNARNIIEETGSNGLYLAMGSLYWTDREKRTMRSPLILVPVNLISKNRGKEFYLSIDEGGQVMPNFSLAEKLRRDEGIELENFVNLVEDDSGVDINGTFEYLRKKLSDAGLLDFRVDENAVLGFFNFSTYRLWRDLLDNWKTFAENPLVHHFIETPNDDFIDPVHEPIDTNLDALVSRLPISSDASQARAISMAMAGRTFILQGPPGTGKSQTIANLLARALSEGKRVLFVAQKKEALDVVKTRLDAAGLGAFTLNLHDKGMNPKDIKEQLSNVIDISIAADQVGFDIARGEYDGSLAPLQNYRTRLHEAGRLGDSIYSARDKRLAIQSPTTLLVTGEFIAETTLELNEQLLQSCKTIAEIGPLTGTANVNPWSISGRNSQYSEAELAEIKSLARSMRTSLERVMGNATSTAYMKAIQSPEDLIQTRSLEYKEVETSLHVDLASMASQEAQRNSVKTLTVLQDSIKKFDFDISRLDSLEIEMWLGKAQEANTAFALFRGMKQGSVLKKVSSILGASITSDKTQVSSVLEELRSLKARKLHAATDLSKVPGLDIDPVANLYLESTIDEYQGQLSRLMEVTAFLTNSNIGDEIIRNLMKEAPSGSVAPLVQIGRDTAALFSILECTPESVALWQGTSSFAQRLIDSIPQWAVDMSEHSSAQLTRWQILLDESKVFADSGLTSALHSLLSGEVPFMDAPNAFQDGYYKALGSSLVVERGFNTFEAMTINNHIRKFEDAHNQIRDRLPRMTGAELLRRRGFDSSMKVGAIGDLVAALKQPRSRMPISTLLTRNWGVIAKVTPCVLAVPEAVVRFLNPALPPFDLVIFDEASQIRVANSIGAMGRGKTVVVVGDSKQMPPTSVAQIRVTDNGTDEFEEAPDGLLGFDMDSILEQCVVGRVPDIMLNWHYRSEDESLIAFSNKKYYEGKLNSFPSPSNDKSFKGLSFEYVKGGKFWRDENKGEPDAAEIGTNPAEVKAIVAYLAKRLKDPATKNDSVGIVTFNIKQQDAVIQALSNSDDPDIQRAMSEGVGGETILVKSLEFVQGTERDVILFSVAFSTNLKGDLPLNFGPLNNSGGERRLNVAITRARKQIRIFCSFKPDELINRGPTATGVLHLAQYLKVAAKEDEEETGIYTTHESHPDRTRREILAELRKAGLNAVEEVGLSDFKVDIAIYDPKDSTKAVMGILLDGPRWNTRETVSDRDCLSVTLLRDRMGWPAIERIWLASWLRNPGDEIQRIVDATNKVLTTGPAPKVKSEKKVAAEPIFTILNPEDVERGESLIDKLLASVDLWRPMNPSLVGDKTYLDYLYDPRVVKVVQDIADQLTKYEGPVSSEHFAKFVGSCFGFDRVVANRAAAINQVSMPAHQRDDEGFIYPKGETFFTYSSWRRGDEFSSRSISDISLSEISNAMKAICTAAQGIRPEQLNKEVSRLFGIAKVSAATNKRLDMALAFALSNGRLVKSGDYLQAAQ